MKNFIQLPTRSLKESETRSELLFQELGQCWHLYTPEQFEIIFATEDDFKAGMTLMAICSKAFPDVRILTFELMSNHVHATLAGLRERILAFFGMYGKHLSGYLHGIGRPVDLSSWECQLREITDLNDLRTVIVYNNRNGYLVNPSVTPFSYPWGANRFFFNPELRGFHDSSSIKLTVKEIRRIFKTRSLDMYAGLSMVSGYASPIGFCEIETTERLFRDARQYFYKLSRDVESQKTISSELGSSVCFTDDELYSIVLSKCHSEYNVRSASLLTIDMKIELAKTLHFDYHANNRQVARILRLDRALVDSVFPDMR